MSAAASAPHTVFVQADGLLAEYLCSVELLGLTLERAEHLRRIHSGHRPDDCLVHLAAAVFLIEAADR